MATGIKDKVAILGISCESLLFAPTPALASPLACDSIAGALKRGRAEANDKRFLGFNNVVAGRRHALGR